MISSKLIYFCFRPALVVENIPGLYFLGNQKKPNHKIRVDHVVESEEESNDVEEVSITDSTTSKFEKLEKICDSMNNEVTSKNEEKVGKYITEPELKALERRLLKQRVYEILGSQKYAIEQMEKQEQKNAEEAQNHETVKQSSGDDKYSTSFETVDTSSDEKMNNNSSAEEPVLVQSSSEENQEKDLIDECVAVSELVDESAATVSEENEVVEPEHVDESLLSMSDSAVLDENEVDMNMIHDDDDDPATPPVPDTPPQAPDAGDVMKMLSTIEEVTTVADTEEETDNVIDEDQLTEHNNEDLEHYSDNFVSSNITDSVEAAAEDFTDTVEVAPEASDSENSLVKDMNSEVEDLVEQKKSEAGSDEEEPKSEADSVKSEEQIIVEDVLDEIIETGVVNSGEGVNQDDVNIIESGQLSDSDEDDRDETDGCVPDLSEDVVNAGVDVQQTNQDIQDLQIKILDRDSCHLTPEKKVPRDGEEKQVIKVSPNSDKNDMTIEEGDNEMVDNIDVEREENMKRGDISEECDTSHALVSSLDHDHVRVSDGDDDHVRVSDGELLADNVDSSEGELSLGGEASISSDQVQRHESSGVRMSWGVLDSSTSSGSWSEGEWRASPDRMRRFINMAAAFRMIKE